MIYLDILNYIKTTQDLNQILTDVDNLLLSVFDSKNQNIESSLNKISLEKAKIIKEAILKNGLDMSNPMLIKNFLQELKVSLGRLKIIKLILSFEPSLQTIDKIYSWVLTNLGEGYILNFELNRNILGGTIIVSPKGEYYDYTVKKILENTFSAKRIEILQKPS